MEFLDPRTDFAFKKVFGSEGSTEILLDFINDILALPEGRRIRDVTILDPYLAPQIKGMKDTYLDVRAVDEQGRQHVIEMQVLNVEGFEKRVLFNACKSYVGQLRKGMSYSELCDVIAITVTDFVMFPGLPGVITSFKMQAQDVREQLTYGEDLSLVFAELPKFEKEAHELEDGLDRWLYFLKRAGSLSSVPKELAADPQVSRALEIMNAVNMTPEELEAQHRRIFYIHDQRGAVIKARKTGLAEGLAQGRDAERRAVARRLLDTLDDEAIAGATGLAVEEVRRLRAEGGEG